MLIDASIDLEQDVIQHVCRDKELFLELMECFNSNNLCLAHKATQALLEVNRKKPEWIQEQVADLDNRTVLAARFDVSQSVYRKDPWAQHVVKAETYQPIANLTLEAAE